MGKSDLLRVQDVRDAYRLIGECRDLGGEPALWHFRMSAGLCRLIGAEAASGGEGVWIRPHAIRPISAFDNFDPIGRERLMAYFRENGPAADPIFGALRRVPGRLITCTRRELVPDRVWYRCASFNDYRRVAGIDHQLTSIYQVSDEGAISGISLHRAMRTRDFSPREQRLLKFFHGELGRLIGRQLVSATEPSPGTLSPRLRQTLACLVEGDSEKQVAARLGLSPPTVHQYVTTLYRRFGVRSRGQLLAHVLKCSGRADWTWASGVTPLDSSRSL
jgi:DNA-binding CsgD family transcriptional regulator